MLTEDYCNFETSKLLKEKGFDGEESPFYCEQDRDKWRLENSYTVPNPCYDSELPFDTEILTMIAPHVSLQMAIKWLRESFGIHCQIDCPIAASNWVYGIRDLNKDEWVTNYRNMGDNDTYEEACEAAIKYCLENLI